MMVIFGFATLSIVQQGRLTLTLQYFKPVPFPPPMMFLPPPSHGYMTALDACSIEAATITDAKGGMIHSLDKYYEESSNKQVGVSGLEGRRVYVYLWGNSVGPSDVWGKWVSRLPHVHLGFLDLPKIVSLTPVQKLAQMTGWTTKPGWYVWMAGRVGLLWAAGGVVLPLGVVMTRAMWVEAAGSGSGMLMMGSGKMMEALVLSSPAHHPLLTNLAHQLVDIDDVLASQDQILTKTVQKTCGEDLSLLLEGNCRSFTILPPSAVFDMHFAQDTQTAKTPPEAASVNGSAVLLRYTGELHHLENQNKMIHLFQSYQLENYCPKTSEELKRMYHDHHL
nr:uncharacterized protein LOC128691004 [Cherax quadricarinatus]